MTPEKLKEFERNIHTGNFVIVAYRELYEWYSFDSFDEQPEMDELFDVSLCIHDKEYWLEILSCNTGCVVADEVINKDDTGVLADWLFNRD